MTQKEIFDILSKPEICHFFNDMSQVHMYTKHYLLISEEISEEGVTFLQPLKEHRDAYDHLMRIFSIPIKKAEEKDIEKYKLDNVKKAFGHEYRAFFDTADWFTYICRKYIREELSFNAKKKIYKENPERAQKLADEILKNTYRTLMTRGMKGCYVYCTDSKLATYLKSCLKTKKKEVAV